MSARAGSLALDLAPPLELLRPALFAGLAIALSWTLVVALGTSLLVLAVATWIPGLLAIAALRLGGGHAVARLGLDRMGWADAYLVALWLPVAFAAGIVALTCACGLGRLDPDLGGEAMSARIVNALTLAPLVNVAVMLGPELGWRAFLLPRLLGLGTWRAIAVASGLWTLWQLPLAPGPLAPHGSLDGVVTTLWCLLIGAILGWLYVRTRSPWAPALFAAAIGATSPLPALVLRDVAPAVAGPVSPLALALPALAVLVVRVLPLPRGGD